MSPQIFESCPLVVVAQSLRTSGLGGEVSTAG